MIGADVLRPGAEASEKAYLLTPLGKTVLEVLDLVDLDALAVRRGSYPYDVADYFDQRVRKVGDESIAVLKSREYATTLGMFTSPEVPPLVAHEVIPTVQVFGSF